MNNEIKTGVYTLDGEDTPFAFYTSLSAYRKSQFVVSVCNTLVGDNYNYVLDDLVFDYFIVAIFTDIDVSEVQKSDNGISAMEEFVEKFKPVIDTVKANTVDGVLDELRKAIDLNIEYRTGIHINPISSSIASFIDTIERKVDGIDLNSMMDLAQSMAGISDELTADKLLDAYAKTDVFKKHWGNPDKDDVVEHSGFSVVGGSYDATSDTKGVTAPPSSVTE